MSVTLTCKEYREDDCHLVDGVSGDILHHRARDEWFGAAVRLALKQLLRRQLGRQSERRERVHDQVHPEHLDRLQRRILRRAIIGGK